MMAAAIAAAAGHNRRFEGFFMFSAGVIFHKTLRISLSSSASLCGYREFFNSSLYAFICCLKSRMLFLIILFTYFSQSAGQSHTHSTNGQTCDFGYLGIAEPLHVSINDCTVGLGCCIYYFYQVVVVFVIVRRLLIAVWLNSRLITCLSRQGNHSISSHTINPSAFRTASVETRKPAP